LLNLPAFNLTIYFGPFLGLEAQYKTSWSIILCCPPPSSSLFRQNAPTSFASTHSLIANLVVLCNFGNCTQLIKIKIQCSIDRNDNFGAFWENWWTHIIQIMDLALF
jgi:hypothetical protein